MDSMTIAVLTFIIAVVLFLLITEKVRVDVLAIGILAVLLVTRILTPAEAVAGFAAPAVITVAAMFIIGRGMIRTGAVGFIGEKVLKLSGGRENLAMILVLLIVAVASAFINNTPLVVLFIPIILSLSCEYNLSPSKLLIPLSYASVLGGTCTLIGTSTNIIISDLSRVHGYGELGMFELASLGVPIAIMGIALIFFTAHSLMPGHATPTCDLEDRDDRNYLAELVVPEKSAWIGTRPGRPFFENYASVELLEIVHNGFIFYPDRYRAPLQANDLLLVKGSANDLIGMLNNKEVALPNGGEESNTLSAIKGALIVELIITPQSSLLGESLPDTPIYRNPDIQIIAVKRRRVHYSEQKTNNIILRVGDILLIRCLEKDIPAFRESSDYILAEDVHHEIILKQKTPLAIGIFSAMMAAAATGLADIMVCAVAAVLLMILTGCVSMRDAYRSISGEVLMLIVGTIALGTAMEKTGTASFYAEMFLGFFRGLGPTAALGGVLVLTSLLSHVLSNNASAVLLVPIAVSVALGLGVHPKPFILAVCFGASACFASPIGYQTNLLVYGPGGYRFSDYLKMGIPLNILVWIMGTLFIPMIWPF